MNVAIPKRTKLHFIVGQQPITAHTTFLLHKIKSIGSLNGARGFHGWQQTTSVYQK